MRSKACTSQRHVVVYGSGQSSGQRLRDKTGLVVDCRCGLSQVVVKDRLSKTTVNGL